MTDGEQSWLWWLLESTWEWAESTDLWWLIGLAAIRASGTTVTSGTQGLRFTFGRAGKLLDPGFHLLLPGINQVRKAPVRSRTLDLPTQRVCTAAGLAYDVNANVTFHVHDLRASLIEVADLDRGLLDALAMAVWKVMRAADHRALQDVHQFDGRLHEVVQAAAAPWGITIDEVGFTSVAPIGASRRLTQLPALLQERASSLAVLESVGLPRSRALALVGGHLVSTTRRQRLTQLEREHRRRRRPARARPSLEPPETGPRRIQRMSVALAVATALLTALISGLVWLFS